MHLYESIGNVQINWCYQTFCVIFFSYLVDNRKCWNLTLKLTSITSSVHVDN